jgi:hypothetical protein
VSLTTTISYDERFIWVLDEARAIWLKYLIEAVEQRSSRGAWSWMADELYDWRTVATLGDYAWSLGPWTDTQRDDFVDAAREARDALVAEPPLSLETVSRWVLLDDIPLVQRLGGGVWDDPIDIRPILELGEAVVQLLRDTLSAPPPGEMWLFGFRGGRQTLKSRSGTG